ncbi:hypothetical protein [Chryseobacterium daeguense]|uniref:hypothetical protein n=1 Tax=Chryseobacterium daeguense TaxID=412438 RepID=UPI00041DE8FA|nr:hypothetical protein [Chryseobacterium daeguense]
MFEDLLDEINERLEEQNRDFKYKLEDKLIPINFNCTLSVCYDYILLDDSEYSFLNPEFNKITSEAYSGMSDAHIYFLKLQKLCISRFEDLSNDTLHFKTVTFNKKIKEITKSIFSKNLSPEQIPSFIEIKLYTNKNSNKAPRIFGFIGHTNMLYILFYDPFHKIFDKNGKI